MTRGSFGFMAAAGVAAILTGCSDGSSSSGSAAANSATSTSQSVGTTLSGTPQTVVEAGSAYSFTPALAKSSDDRVIYSIDNKPLWATFDPSSGTLAGHPTAAYVGVYPEIKISASNGVQNFTLAPFSIAVAQAETNADSAEIGIAGIPAQWAVVGKAYSFSPIVIDPAGAAYSFAIANKPAWATFDPLTGSLSGTPVAADVGVDAKIEITVSDGTASDTLTAFSISVGLTAPAVASITGAPARVPATAAAPNTPPAGLTPAASTASTTALTIAGSPADSASVGVAYSFSPTVNGPTGVTYSFAVANLPSWASFSTSTGKLSGTPAAGNVGVDSQIAITVSNGTTKAALPAFSISVAATAAESATLSWTEPTVNSNGTAITDLAGYHVYYGTSAKDLTHMIAVDSPSDTGEVISNLAHGTWYIGVKSFNAQNVESTLSAVVAVTI